MGKTATLNIRVNPDVKENAESVLAQLGDTNGYCYRYVFKTNIISRRNSLFYCITKSS